MPPSNPLAIDFTVHLAERARGFTGRDWVFREVDDWLADPDGARFFLLTGEPGAGKTAVAARLAQMSAGTARQPAGLSRLGPGSIGAIHFCSVRDRRWISPQVFAESLSRQLSTRYDNYARAVLEGVAPSVSIHQEARENWGRIIGAEIGTLVVTAGPEDLFNRLVREPLEAVVRDELLHGPVVILIDALDESLTYTGQITIADLVAQADNLSPDVRFIVTCRPENDLLRTLRGRSARELTLSPGRDDPTGAPVRVLHDVQEYLEQVLSEKKPTLESDLSLPELVTTIRNQSEGNFLYVRHLLRALTTRPEPITHTSLEQLPTGLDQVYLEFLQRLVGKDLDTWHRGHDKVLGVIAVGQVPLTEDLIGHCCVVGSR